MNNLVSIITALYNSESFIESTINSVLSQTYSNWKIITDDDATTENICAIIQEIAVNSNKATQNLSLEALRIVYDD